VLFCESLVFQNTCFVLLTRNVPYFDFWNTDARLSGQLAAMKKYLPLEELGKELASTSIPLIH